MNSPWSYPVRLAEIDRGPQTLDLAPDHHTRARIAKVVGVDALNSLDAKVTLKPWLDGAELAGRITANVTQICGITLDPFQSPIETTFTVRVLPAGSKNAPGPETHELVVDPDAEDPPEVLEGDVVDVGTHVLEYLALEVDPFPRKPGAVFESPEPPVVISPFAALAALKGKDEPH